MEQPRSSEGTRSSSKNEVYTVVSLSLRLAGRQTSCRGGSTPSKQRVIYLLRATLLRRTTTQEQQRNNDAIILVCMKV